MPPLGPQRRGSISAFAELFHRRIVVLENVGWGGFQIFRESGKLSCVPYPANVGQQPPEFVRPTNLKARELDAVNRTWGLVGFTLTLPTFSPERPYQMALDWSTRISNCVTPPAASEIHMTRPSGSKSKELMRTSPEEKTCLEIPEPIERSRIVQS